jgi:hypothetical protein
VVETTAFFRRTSVATFPPTGDGWETQRYNQQAFATVAAELVRGAPPQRTEQPVAFYIDRLGPVTSPGNGSTLRVPRDQPLGVSGWALDTARTTAASAVDLVLDGGAYRTAIRVPRGDVAGAHGSFAYLRSGFNAELPKALMTPGTHHLEVRILLAGAREYVSTARFRLEVA